LRDADADCGNCAGRSSDALHQIASSIRQASGQNKANQIHVEKAATYHFFMDLLQQEHDAKVARKIQR